MSDMIYKFCPRCGAVTKSMICDNCGYDLNAYDNENYTINSENNENSFEYEPNVYEEQTPVQEKKRKNLWWVWALPIGVMVLSVIIVIFVLCLGFIMALFFKANASSGTSFGSNNQSSGSGLYANLDADEDDLDEMDLDQDEVESDLDEDDMTGYDDAYNDSYDYIISSGYNVYEYDFDEMKEYLDDANEWNDDISDEKSDYFYSDYYVTATGKIHIPMTKDDFTEPYFSVLADYYDDSYDYDIERRFVRVEGQLEGIFCNLYGSYYTLESDDVDFTEVNEYLKERTYANLYRVLSQNSIDMTGENFTAYADSYITFNNDEIMSIVYDDYSYLGTYTESLFWDGVNIDLKNGKVIDNTDLLDVDEEFAKYFVERSNIQNSYVYAINANSAENVKNVFEDPTGLILFFSPVGMEVGINYMYGGTFGWVTVTVNDFDEYISEDYDFDTSFSSEFDAETYEKENGITANGVEVYGRDYDWSNLII